MTAFSCNPLTEYVRIRLIALKECLSQDDLIQRAHSDVCCELT